MRQFVIFILLLFSASILSEAENVVIKSPGYFKSPLRDGHELFPDSLVYPRDAESIHIPDIGMIGRFEDYGFTNLRLLLHPGEVRHRLQHDMPLILNKDANWNNRDKVAKEDYLDEYMAKNLYIMSANTLNQAEPEGTTSHAVGKIAAIVPIGSNYKNAHIITTDDEWFWSAPDNVK